MSVISADAGAARLARRTINAASTRRDNAGARPNDVMQKRSRSESPKVSCRPSPRTAFRKHSPSPRVRPRQSRSYQTRIGPDNELLGVGTPRNHKDLRGMTSTRFADRLDSIAARLLPFSPHDKPDRIGSAPITQEFIHATLPGSRGLVRAHLHRLHGIGLSIANPDRIS